MSDRQDFIMQQKLVVTIIQKGVASKIVSATKKAGTEGGTILFARGTGGREFKKLFGMTIDPEKEMILTMVHQDMLDQVLKVISDTGNLQKPGKGICFVLDIWKAVGIIHLLHSSPKGGSVVEKNENNGEPLYDLIISIVDKGFADTVVDATKAAGAEGGTITYGRGTGIHEKAKLFGIPIEPEKEVVLTLITRDKTEQILQTVLDDCQLCRPGKGVAFVLHVEKTVGINHPVC